MDGSPLFNCLSRSRKIFLRFLGKFLTISTGVPQAATGASRSSVSLCKICAQARRALFQECRASFQFILKAFPVLELGTRWLVGKLWKYNFQKNLNFFIWCPFDPSKTDFPITSQKRCMLVQKNIALIAGYFSMPSFHRNLARDGS